jgi:hypothetical protein
MVSPRPWAGRLWSDPYGLLRPWAVPVRPLAGLTLGWGWSFWLWGCLTIGCARHRLGCQLAGVTMGMFAHGLGCPLAVLGWPCLFLVMG